VADDDDAVVFFLVQIIEQLEARSRITLREAMFSGTARV